MKPKILSFSARRCVKRFSSRQRTTFLLLPNHIFDQEAHSALLGGIDHGALQSQQRSRPLWLKTKRPVTLKHLAAVLAQEHQLTKRAGEALLGDLVSLITKHLKKGERVRIAGLGILQVRKRAARMGRNPATGEAIQIKRARKSHSGHRRI